jgi:DNA-binding NtrC family response regulator
VNDNVRPTVLIVDDETGILETLEILLRSEGFAPQVAQGGRAGLEALEKGAPDIVLTDVRMPQVTGVEILAAARRKDADMPVILMTAQATLQTAVQAVNEGAFYYIQKPFRNDELVAILRRAAEHRHLRMENTTLKREIRRRDRATEGAPIGASKKWLEVMRMAEAVAGTESTVLITGESGTGKEVVARYLHELSTRADGPFLSINCGALPEGLLESELFGHVKGSFTGAVKDKSGLFTAAGTGTFFLDEIGETTQATQVKLLRVLQQREIIPVGATDAVPIDVRIIAATNRDLIAEMKKGTFRQDLYYRLNVFPIEVPPLRERLEDIPLLVWAFVQEFGEKMGKKITRVARRDMENLQRYAWPGNVRELRNVIEHAVIVSSGDTLRIRLPEEARQTAVQPLTLQDVEYRHITHALRLSGGRIKGSNGAARILGLNPSTLYFRMKKLGISFRNEKDSISSQGSAY